MYPPPYVPPPERGNIGGGIGQSDASASVSMTRLKVWATVILNAVKNLIVFLVLFYVFNNVFNSAI